MIIVDSDVLIDGLRGREPAAGRIAAEINAGTLVTTIISVFELLSGAKTQKERTKVETLLAAAAILPLDVGAAKSSAAIRRELEAKGEKIGMADYLIAGICLEQSASLLTRNLSHFRRIPGLSLDQL